MKSGCSFSNYLPFMAACLHRYLQSWNKFSHANGSPHPVREENSGAAHYWESILIAV